MTDPALNLIVFALIVAALAILFWPKRGLVALMVGHLRVTDRVRMEDALKHLYKAQSSARIGSIESVAGALGVPRSKAVRLVAKLESSGLMKTTDRGLLLTADGRAYALRIVRSHRLWERFLSLGQSKAVSPRSSDSWP